MSRSLQSKRMRVRQRGGGRGLGREVCGRAARRRPSPQPSERGPGRPALMDADAGGRTARPPLLLPTWQRARPVGPEQHPPRAVPVLGRGAPRPPPPLAATAARRRGARLLRRLLSCPRALVAPLLRLRIVVVVAAAALVLVAAFVQELKLAVPVHVDSKIQDARDDELRAAAAGKERVARRGATEPRGRAGGVRPQAREQRGRRHRLGLGPPVSWARGQDLRIHVSIGGKGCKQKAVDGRASCKSRPPLAKSSSLALPARFMCTIRCPLAPFLTLRSAGGSAAVSRSISPHAAAAWITPSANSFRTRPATRTARGSAVLKARGRSQSSSESSPATSAQSEFSREGRKTGVALSYILGLTRQEGGMGCDGHVLLACVVSDMARSTGMQRRGPGRRSAPCAARRAPLTCPPGTRAPAARAPRARPRCTRRTCTPARAGSAALRPLRIGARRQTQSRGA